MSQSIRQTFYLNKEDVSNLKNKAERNDMSLSRLLRKIIRNYLKNISNENNRHEHSDFSL